VEWLRYQKLNGDNFSHSVWMNVAGLTSKSRLPLTKTLSIYGEGGLAIITRKGFNVNSAPALTDANYATLLLGSGLQYRVKNNWDLVVGDHRVTRSFGGSTAAYGFLFDRIQLYDAAPFGRTG
jgi:hypothetical protein